MLNLDQLILDNYLMLRRTHYFLSAVKPSQVLLTNPVIEFREINLLVPFLDLEDDPAEELLPELLPELLLKVIHDPHINDLLFIFIVKENGIEEADLYLNLLLLDISEQNSVSFDKIGVSIIDIREWLADWNILSPRIDGFYSFFPSLTDYPIPLAECLEDLPQLTLDADQSIVENLYASRLQKSGELGALAADSFRRRNWSDSIRLYQKAIDYNPFKPSLWVDMSSALLQSGQYLPAKQFIQKAIVLDSSQSIYYNNLGLIHEALGEYSEAIESYQIAIQIDLKDSNSYCNLGNLLIRLNQIGEAEDVYRNGINANPWHFGLYLNLGNLCLQNDRYTEAIVQYQSALKYSPNNPDILGNLSIATQNIDPKKSLFYKGKQLEIQKDYPEAIGRYEQVVEIDPFYWEAYLGLCNCYQGQQEFPKVGLLVEKIGDQIRNRSNQSDFDFDFDFRILDFVLIHKLFSYLNRQDEHPLSRYLVENSNLFQTTAFSQLFSAVNFPILYESEAEMEEIRQHFIQVLEKIKSLDLDLDLEESHIQSELFGLIQGFVHAFINYQCKNDLEIQCLYATIVEKILAIRYPQFSQPLSIPALKKGERIRLGYISYHLRGHNGARWALGWLKNHDRSVFEIYTYHLGDSLDAVTQEFCENADYFKHLPNEDFLSFSDWLDCVLQSIRQDDLHILIFPDIGMEVRTILLSKLRLAPIQCTAWGHPITSGSKYVDYYLSSHLMEPDNAQDHYTEKIIRLPNLGLCYPHPCPTQSSRTRSSFDLPDDRIIYLSCQSLFKYLPQYDFIYPEIARQIPNACFVFLETFYLKSKFNNRLERAFSKVGLSSQNYCQILPGQSWQNYIQLQYLSDIYLDTIAWTGGNSTLEAIACALPVVTYPGEFMRSRHSYAILQQLGVTETIAHSIDEYIEIAVELGRNQGWRQSIANQYKQRQSRLFNDRSVTQSLDQVLITLFSDIVQNSSSAHHHKG